MYSLVRSLSESTIFRSSIALTFQPAISSPTRTRVVRFSALEKMIANASSALMMVPCSSIFGGWAGGGAGGGRTLAVTICGARRLGENSGCSRVAESRSNDKTASGLSDAADVCACAGASPSAVDAHRAAADNDVKYQGPNHTCPRRHSARTPMVRRKVGSSPRAVAVDGCTVNVSTNT